MRIPSLICLYSDCSDIDVGRRMFSWFQRRSKINGTTSDVTYAYDELWIDCCCVQRHHHPVILLPYQSPHSTVHANKTIPSHSYFLLIQMNVEFVSFVSHRGSDALIDNIKLLMDTLSRELSAPFHSLGQISKSWHGRLRMQASSPH